MQRFTELTVWQRGHALTLAIYDATRSFPKDEVFGLTSQLRRASVSVPCNIAEGSKRRHRPDYARFLNMAEASLAEVESLLMLSRDLGNLSQPKTTALIDEAQEIARMLCVLRRKVEVAQRTGDASRTVNC
jgi:four helix bundle protein